MGRLKMRDMKQRLSQKCRGGNCEKRKLWHIVAARGVEIAVQASMDSQKNTSFLECVLNVVFISEEFSAGT